MLAEWWALWSTCTKMPVGAVVVTPEFQVVVSGFNGAPRGAPHCNEQEQPLVDKDGHCLYCIHAEMNCSNQAARLGASLQGTTMYCLYRPCIRCATNMAQWGLHSVVYRDPYEGDSFEAEAVAMLERAGVEVRQMDWTPSMEAFRLLARQFRAYYRTGRYSSILG